MKLAEILSEDQTNNSVKQIVDYLVKSPFRSETQILQDVFRYERSNSYESNKKYAEMLRRGVQKGIIARVEAKVRGDRSSFYYYIPA